MYIKFLVFNFLITRLRSALKIKGKFHMKSKYNKQQSERKANIEPLE